MCCSKSVLLHVFPLSFLTPRWLSSTLAASSAPLRLPSFPWEPPTHTAGPYTRGLCHSPHCHLSSATAIPPFRPRCAPCPSPSSVHPPPLQFQCPSGPAPACGPPGPAAPHAGAGGLGAAAPSARDAAEDGGPEAQDDAAPYVSTTIALPPPGLTLPGHIY